MGRMDFQQRLAPKIQRPLYLILIATEGSITEQQYFPMVNSCNTQNVVVEMVDDGTTNSAPEHVLKRMKDAIREHHFQKDDKWEAWIVIDKEWNPPQLDKLFAWRGEDTDHHHVSIVCPKFEEWLKLHVRGDKDAIRRYGAFLSHRHGCQDVPEGFVNKDRIRQAIALASKMDVKPKSDFEQVYVLVEKILNVKI